jgi:hypothetical protein
MTSQVLTIPTFTNFLERMVESPLWVNVRECRNEMKAARASGQSTNTILMKWYECKRCSIGIGPEHYEKELYFYRNRGNFRLCCGGCARHYGISEEQAIIRGNDDWQETALDIALTHPAFGEESDPGKRRTILLVELKAIMDKRILEARGAHTPKVLTLPRKNIQYSTPTFAATAAM